MKKRGHWLVPSLSALFLTLLAWDAQALTPFNSGQGAYFSDAAPMDLAAAVSELNPDFPNSGPYLVQFTNGGLFVFNKNNNPPTPVGATPTQWDFWCNGTGLTDCDPTAVNGPYDTQISYDSTNGHWIVAALSDNGSTKGAYLYVGISKNADPQGAYYQYALPACTTYPGTIGDNPIMGISTVTNGRIVVDLPCFFDPTDYDADEIFDIDIDSVEDGSALDTSCSNTTNCRIFTNNPNVSHLRPVNNLGTHAGIILSSVFLNGQDDASLFLYKLHPGSSIGTDTLEQFDPRPGHSTAPQPFYSSVVVYSGPGAVGFLAPQPGCSSSSCQIRTDTLEPEGGAVQTNASGYDIFATSFAAVAQDGTDSYYFAFVLNTNPANGTFNFVKQTATNGIIGYASSTLDSDSELVVNYTTFTATGSSTSVDVINWSPISSASIVKTYPAIASTTVETPTFDCLLGPCRWGDYTAEVYDPSCRAVNQGKGSECGLFWTTAEYIPTPSGGGRGTVQNSWIAAVKDDVETGDTDTVTFVASNNAETDCVASPCDVTFAAPAGTQVGDLLLVAMSSTGAIGWVPSTPAGWNILTFQNTGNPNFASTDNTGGEESGWLLTHVYESSDAGSYTFSEENCGADCEVGGLILDYRGVRASAAASLSAWGYGSNADEPTAVVGEISVPAYNELVAVFKDGADEHCITGGGCTEPITLSYSPVKGYGAALTSVTPTSFASDGWDGFAADVWNGGTSASLGPYSTGATSGGVNVVALPLGWEVLLPSGLE